MIDGEFSTQGWNRYAYCKGNPIRYKDPTGHNIMVLEADKGAHGAGHTAGLVESVNAKSGKTEWHYYSRNGQNKALSSDLGVNYTPTFKNPEEFFKRQSEAVKTRESMEKDIKGGKIALDKEGNLDLSKIKDEKMKQKYIDAKELTYFDDKSGKASARYERGLEFKTNSIQDTKFERYMIEHLNDKYILTGNNCKDLISRGLDKAGLNNMNSPLAIPDLWYDSLKQHHNLKDKIVKEHIAPEVKK